MILVLLSFSLLAFSQSRLGKPDASFGNKGVTQAGICGLTQMLELPNQGLFVVKQAKKTLTLLKLTRAGKWDTGFADRGVLRLPDWTSPDFYTQIVLQSNSDVLLVGKIDIGELADRRDGMRLVLVSALGKIKFQSRLEIPLLNKSTAEQIKAREWVWSGNRLLLAYEDVDLQRLVFARYVLTSEGQLVLDTSFATEGYAEFSVVAPQVLSVLSALGSGTPYAYINKLDFNAAGDVALAGTIAFRFGYFYVAKLKNAGVLESRFGTSGLVIDKNSPDLGQYAQFRLLSNGGLVVVFGSDNSPQGDALNWSVEWLDQTGQSVDYQGLDILEYQNLRTWVFAGGQVLFADQQKLMLHRPKTKPFLIGVLPPNLEGLHLTTDNKILTASCEKNQLLIRRGTF